MTFVYHLVPKNITGDVLYPLNMLKTYHPEIYENRVQKYQGREQVIERRIPILNCLWNDVVFFTNVHPEAIRDGFVAISKQWKPQKWYAINPPTYGFNAQNTVLYYPDMSREKGDFTLSLERFASFDAGKLETIYELPSATLAYYREAAERGDPIFAWHGLPHVLHHGSVALANVDLITI